MRARRWKGAAMPACMTTALRARAVSNRTPNQRSRPASANWRAREARARGSAGLPTLRARRRTVARTMAADSMDESASASNEAQPHDGLVRVPGNLVRARLDGGAHLCPQDAYLSAQPPFAIGASALGETDAIARRAGAMGRGCDGAAHCWGCSDADDLLQL